VARGERRVVGLDLHEIGARGVEQAVAHHGADGTRRDHRFGNEAVDGVEQMRLVDARVRHDLECCVEGEMAGEDGKPAQHDPFTIRQQSVAPVERGLQCLLPGRGGALALPEQVEALVEQCGGLRKAIGFDPAGGELDCQRHAVELAADVRDDRSICIVEYDLRTAGRRTFEEQLQRWIGLCRRGCHPGIIWRHGKWRQPIHLFALDAQSLAARGEDVDLRCTVKDLRRQRCRCVDDVLAIVQDQQHPCGSQKCDQRSRDVFALNGEAERGSDRGGE